MGRKFSGEKLKQWRKHRGLTQVELAEILGLRNSDIYKYESGTVKNPEPDRVEALAKALDVKPEDLYASASKEETAMFTKPIDQHAIDLLLSMDDDTREHVIYFVQQVVSRNLHKKGHK